MATEVSAMQGWLLKRGHLITEWHLRYFELHKDEQGTVTYRREQEAADEQEKGIIFARGGALSCSDALDGKRYIITLQEKARDRTHVMCCELKLGKSSSDTRRQFVQWFIDIGAIPDKTAQAVLDEVQAATETEAKQG